MSLPLVLRQRTPNQFILMRMVSRIWWNLRVCQSYALSYNTLFRHPLTNVNLRQLGIKLNCEDKLSALKPQIILALNVFARNCTGVEWKSNGSY